MKKISIVLFAAVLCLSYLSGCKSQENDEGKELSKKFCQSCHQLPDVASLNKLTWANYVLPKMGGFLGFGHFESGSYYENGKTDVMLLSDWDKIVSYYVRNAPDSLEAPADKQNITIGLKNFDVMPLPFALKDPATTYVGIFDQQNEISFADGISKQVYRFSADGNFKDSFEVKEGVVNVRFTGSEIWTLAMGVLYPSDERLGSLDVMNTQTKSSYTLLDSLQRPVYADYADLNNDNLEDIVICEFGNLTGDLAWFENKGNKKFLKHILRALPGAVKTQLADLNGDGKMDILSLMAQGDEGIFVYYNKGNGNFEEERLLQFPPSYGSNSFELTDINKDGHPDILTTNGDNGDYPPILKPYHGIRIFMNDGKNNFAQKVFLPVNGPCKAITRDFDGDGDLDIASISYFPDYSHHPEESFIFWENAGNLLFQPFSFNNASMGRWLTMEAGDIDHDGDIDLVLGNAKFPLGNIPDSIMKNWNKYSPSLVILKNKTKGF